jgi:hypothetical protein
MKYVKPAIWIYLFGMLGLSSLPGITLGTESETHKLVGGMEIYIGMIPAEVVRGRDLPETKMHGAPPRGKNRYHLVVALFDEKTRQRIIDANITANVAGLGLGGTTKILEQMRVNDLVSFGNYFPLPDNTPYQVRLKLEVPGKPLTESLFNSNGIVR